MSFAYATPRSRCCLHSADVPTPSDSVEAMPEEGEVAWEASGGRAALILGDRDGSASCKIGGAVSVQLDSVSKR